MFNVVQNWNPKQALLRQTIKNGKIEEVKAHAHELHSFAHSSEIYNLHEKSYLDEIFEGLSQRAFRTAPSVKDTTIAWNIWHLTRIEDITSNILIADTVQILDVEWQKKLNTPVKDTGNAMNREEILAFSNEINMAELRNYRDAVAMRTKQVIGDLKKDDLKRKFEHSQINRIMLEGGITEHPESAWLLDFWGKKTVAGILLMPITRHQIVHLNDCSRIKEKCRKLYL